MAVFYELKERRVIPNWRDFSTTAYLGELKISNAGSKYLEFDLSRSLKDWRETQNVGVAADLINSAFVSGVKDKPEIKEAAQWLKKSKGVSTSLLSLVDHLYDANPNAENSGVPHSEITTINDFLSFIKNDRFHSKINRLKRQTRNELRNAIPWVELARLYSMKGQDEQADRAVLCALRIAPDNRYVLRSATRFFIHTGQCDKAVFYLRKSRGIKHDPWLISAHIAASSILERHSPFVKDGIRLIESKNYSDFDITELSSSIGTLELKNGSFRKAKIFLDQSLLDPNDNSLAQLAWLSQDEHRLRLDSQYYENVPNPFEAKSLSLFDKGEWKEAFYEAIKWFLDMPFSKRPIIHASYISGSLLDDKEAAKLLCEVGLHANPLDPTLLNNMIFNIITSDDWTDLNVYLGRLAKLDQKKLSQTDILIFQATLGLVALKEGDSERGISLYELAINNATKIKNQEICQLATINLTKELITQDLPQKATYIDKVLDMQVSSEHKHIKLKRDKVLKLIEQRKDSSDQRELTN